MDIPDEHLKELRAIKDRLSWALFLLGILIGIGLSIVYLLAIAQRTI